MATSSFDDRARRSESSPRFAAGREGGRAPVRARGDLGGARVLRLERGADRSLSYAMLVARGQRAEQRNRPLTARRFYELALCKLAQADSGADAADLLRRIARTHRREADVQLSLDCAEAAVAVAEAHAHARWLGEATNFLGGLRVQLGDLDEAERLYGHALGCAIANEELRLSAMMMHNLGIIANIRGDLDTALARYEGSLTAVRSLGLVRERCALLSDLGDLHLQAGRWDDAGRAWDEAMHVAERHGDRNAQLLIEVKRTGMGIARGDLVAAAEASDRAMGLSRSTRDMPARGAAFLARGIVSREQQAFAQAERHLERARDIAIGRDDVLLLADATRELAELYRRQGRNRDALRSLNRASCLFSQLRARRELADVSRRTDLLEDDFLEVARRWGRSMECTDHYTQGHSERVAEIATALAAADGMDRQTLFWFRIGAMLHDVGKLMLPAGLLGKSGPLTAEEWTAVRAHPVDGVELLAGIEFPWDVRPIVESHHERWDGGGYPHGLAGEAIPRVARIVAIADVYDALTSERPYKAALSHSDAITVMRSDIGRQFDPQLFALFERVAAEHADTWILQLQPGSVTGLAPFGERRREDALLPPVDYCRFRRAALEEPASRTDAFPTAVRPLLARLMHDRMRSSRPRLFHCRDARAVRQDAPAEFPH